MTSRKILSILLALTLCAATLLLAGCGNNTKDPAETGDAPADKVYKIGISQLITHEALDAATEGFKKALVDELGEDKVVFDLQNAAGASDTCVTIANSFVSSKVDLIMTNGTAALQAAANATMDIPILGTSITEYGVALGIDNFSGTVGGNISGTSDLAPLDEQAQMIIDLVPEAKKVGLLYCSAEPNSAYQVKVVKEYLEAKGIEVVDYAFTDSNDVALIAETAATDCDALYVPTDNTAASCTQAIDNVVRPKGVPIIAGEAGICNGCGVATLSISYYDLGYKTGLMAAKILTGEAKIADMAIEYAADPAPKYHVERCEEMGITVPDSFSALD